MECESRRNKETRDIPHELFALHERKIEKRKNQKCGHQENAQADDNSIDDEKKKAEMAWACEKNER